MRKVFLYIILIVFIYFCVPIFLVNKFENKTAQTVKENIELANEMTTKEKKEKEEVKEYNYGKYENIKLLHSDDNKVEEVDIDKYLLNAYAYWSLYRIKL